ncbi:hypothetical protein ABIB35_001302 [Arthrobacter sp. UYP6]
MHHGRTFTTNLEEPPNRNDSVPAPVPLFHPAAALPVYVLGLNK